MDGCGDWLGFLFWLVMHALAICDSQLYLALLVSCNLNEVKATVDKSSLVSASECRRSLVMPIVRPRSNKPFLIP